MLAGACIKIFMNFQRIFVKKNKNKIKIVYLGE